MEASRQFQAAAALLPRKGQSSRTECSTRLEEVLTKTTTTNPFLPSLHVRQKAKCPCVPFSGVNTVASTKWYVSTANFVV
jgi:hypothetical protein